MKATSNRIVSNYRRAGVPLVMLECADPAEVTKAIVTEVNANGKTPAVIQWDVIRGAVGLTPLGIDTVQTLCAGNDPAVATGNPADFLRLLPQNNVPERCVVLMLGAPMLMKEPAIVQAIWNLRDVFKATGSCLVLYVPLGFKLPAELVNDVVTAVIPLPDEAGIEQIARDLYNDAGLTAPTKEITAKVVDALSGLSGFSAEQSLALSLSPTGIDLDGLWERKRRTIEQTPGLSVWRGGEMFADIGGCENAKTFFRRVIGGRRGPRCIVFIDEIEKAMGSTQDTSGVSQAMLGQLLTFMQDKQSAGVIFIGPPGAAKSAIAKAVGNEARCPTIAFDLSGMKGSLVGESEARLRGSLQVVESVGQGRVLFVATCNSIGVLPPELRRRFTLGTFFFDLPTAEEREAIWKIWTAKYGLQKQELPAADGWTGAEIRQACDIADRMNVSLIEAAKFVVPVAVSASDKIEDLRRQASGKFLSASNGGLYRYEAMAAPARSGRKLDLGGAAA